jgi:hypothetical protein
MMKKIILKNKFDTNQLKKLVNNHGNLFMSNKNNKKTNLINRIILLEIIAIIIKHLISFINNKNIKKILRMIKCQR